MKAGSQRLNAGEERQSGPDRHRAAHTGAQVPPEPRPSRCPPASSQLCGPCRCRAASSPSTVLSPLFPLGPARPRSRLHRPQSPRLPISVGRANEYSPPAQRPRTGNHCPARGWGLRPPSARAGAAEWPWRRPPPFWPLPTSSRARVRRAPRSTLGGTDRIPPACACACAGSSRLRTSARPLLGPDVTGLAPPLGDGTVTGVSPSVAL